MTFVVFKNQNFDFSTFNVDDIYKADKLDPGQISTFSGDFSAFKARGGKFITYHGRRDDVSNYYPYEIHTLNYSLPADRLWKL